MQNFIKSLEQSYKQHRKAITTNLSDDELIKNIDFNKCTIISSILNNLDIAETAYSIWSDQDKQDTEKFLDRYIIEYGIGADGFTYVIKEKNVESN